MVGRPSHDRRLLGASSRSSVVFKISCATASRLSSSSSLPMRSTARPRRSKYRSRASSCPIRSLCDSPSSSTTSFASSQKKSATYGPRGCCRRNLKPPSRRSRNRPQRIRSGTGVSFRRWRANFVICGGAWGSSRCMVHSPDAEHSRCLVGSQGTTVPFVHSRFVPGLAAGNRCARDASAAGIQNVCARIGRRIQIYLSTLRPWKSGTPEHASAAEIEIPRVGVRADRRRTRCGRRPPSPREGAGGRADEVVCATDWHLFEYPTPCVPQPQSRQRAPALTLTLSRRERGWSAGAPVVIGLPLINPVVTAPKDAASNRLVRHRDFVTIA